MLSNLTLKKSKQTEKLKVITFFSVAHFGLLLPKTRLILAPVWPFLKKFWFRFRLLKDNSMMMINSTDFASNLQKNRKMWTISYLLRWINNYRVLLLVYLGVYDCISILSWICTFLLKDYPTFCWCSYEKPIIKACIFRNIFSKFIFVMLKSLLMLLFYRSSILASMTITRHLES